MCLHASTEVSAVTHHLQCVNFSHLLRKQAVCPFYRLGDEGLRFGHLPKGTQMGGDQARHLKYWAVVVSDHFLRPHCLCSDLSYLFVYFANKLWSTHYVPGILAGTGVTGVKPEKHSPTPTTLRVHQINITTCHDSNHEMARRGALVLRGPCPRTSPSRSPRESGF